LEQAQETALNTVRDLENQMLRPGISRASAANIRNGQAMRDARAALAQARQQLGTAYAQIQQQAPSVIRSLQGSVVFVRRTGPNALSGEALSNVEAITNQLRTLRDTAQANLASGNTVSTSRWITRLRRMNPSNPAYARTYGNALQEEFFALARAEQTANRLSRNMVFNSGRSRPEFQLPNNYGGVRPDVRLSLGNGREAVWDLTTIGQAGVPEGHAAQYARDFVDYIVDLPYIRP
jgi:hypothetical protein